MFSHQLVSSNHLDHPTPDHPRVYSDGFSYFGLDLWRCIEAEDEMVAGVVLLLMFSDRLGQEEGTPVSEGADDAAVLEEEGAGFVGDSAKGE